MRRECHGKGGITELYPEGTAVLCVTHITTATGGPSQTKTSSQDTFLEELGLTNNMAAHGREEILQNAAAELPGHNTCGCAGCGCSCRDHVLPAPLPPELPDFWGAPESRFASSTEVILVFQRCSSPATWILSAESWTLLRSGFFLQKIEPQTLQMTAEKPCLGPQTRRSELVVIFHTSLYL
ncbi:PREDICTED: uncharacterized protein LOC108494809 isoform X2 [Lepidothrix coronata]|nr:PREDICTED: uncharacterized protein LOC108494809 isoform X2 [Lepidothrix coronata]